MNIMGDFIYKKAKPLPVILLLDTSGSMTIDNNIGTLNNAVREMLRDFQEASNSEASISVAIITFGKNTGVYQPLADVSEINIESINMEAYGMTPMGEAISIAKGIIEDKGQIPSRAYRPTVVLVTDGEPTDDWQSALDKFMNDGRSSKCYRMAMGIGTGHSGEAYNVLHRFVSNEEQVFDASNAGEISQFFQYVTISTTSRTTSANPNMIPNRNSIIGESVKGSAAPAPAKAEDDDDDLGGLLPY